MLLPNPHPLISTVSLQFQMNVTFLEAAIGTTRNVTLSYPVTCTRCQGRKGEPGSGLRTCHRCKGSGHVSYISTSPNYLFITFYLAISTNTHIFVAFNLGYLFVTQLLMFNEIMIIHFKG